MSPDRPVPERGARSTRPTGKAGDISKPAGRRPVAGRVGNGPTRAARRRAPRRTAIEEIRLRALGDDSDRSPQGRLLRTAVQLFYSDGVRAVGIDRLIAEADVAKASFYAHFKSKQDLVVAYLEAWSNGWISWLTDRVRAAGDGSMGAVDGLFDGLEALFKDPEYRGCAFANALAEVGGEMPGVRTIGQAHKRRVADLLSGMFTGGNRAEGRVLAQQIVLVMDGAMATAARDRTAAAARHGRTVAELLLERYRGSALLM